jgi:hypothetical protein
MRVRSLLASLALLCACSPARPPILPPPDAATLDASPDVSAPPIDGGERCARQQDCDDGIPCTEESCVVGGVCERVPNDRLCPMGQRCFPGRGCAAGNSCTRNEDCEDRVPCTRDVCGAGGVCQNVRDDSRCPVGEQCSLTLGCVPPGRCGADADCDDGRYCNGPERCMGGTCGLGTPPNCADMDPCTGDVCNEMTRSCDHVMLNPCGGTVTPGTYTLSPTPNYSCGAGSLDVRQVTLESSPSGVVVRGFPVELRGAPASMGMFSVRGESSIGGCQWAFAMSGTFVMGNQFRGTWTVMFNFCDASQRCFSQFREVTGTRM